MRRVMVVLVIAAGCGEGPDRTPPSVVSRTPAAGDAAAFSGDGFRATFSEPLEEASLTPDAVHVSQATGRVPSSLSLSGDRRTLIIRPSSPLQIPGWVLVELTPGIKDAAGNAFVPDATLWSFDLPVWAQLGGMGSIAGAQSINTAASLALDADGNPVALLNDDGAVSAVRFDGGAWSSMSDVPLGLAAGMLARNAEGDLWLAGDGGDGIGVRQWTGSAWGQTQTVPSTAGPSCREVRLVVRDAGPLVFWSEREVKPMAGGGLLCGVASLHMRSWNGAAWSTWADMTLGNEHVFPVITLAPAGTVFLGWVTGGNVAVARAGPHGLEPIGAAPNDTIVEQMALAAGPDGNPVVAFEQGLAILRVKRWDGASWTAVGEDLDITGATFQIAPALALEGQGHPVVAWAESTGAQTSPVSSPRHLHVARWDGAGWRLLGGPLNVDPMHSIGSIALVLDEHGSPVVGWTEHNGEYRSYAGGEPLPVYEYYVKRLNH